MSTFHLKLEDPAGLIFETVRLHSRQKAINTASHLVNRGIAETIKVYSGLTRIYTARIPK